MHEKTRYTAADLIKRLGEDSQEALGGIMQLYRHSLTRIISIYTHDNELIQEIFMDVMETLWEKRKQVAALNNPYTWLVKVTRNKALNKRRDIDGRQTIAIDWAAYLPGDTDIEKDLDFNELESFIALSGRKLTAREREVFSLSVQYGWNTKAIAQRLKISESTVRNQLASSVRKIRIALSRFFNTVFI